MVGLYMAGFVHIWLEIRDGRCHASSVWTCAAMSGQCSWALSAMIRRSCWTYMPAQLTKPSCLHVFRSVSRSAAVSGIQCCHFSLVSGREASRELLLYNLRFAFSCQAQRRQHLRRHVLRGGALGGIVVQVASPLDPCGALLEAGRGEGWRVAFEAVSGALAGMPAVWGCIIRAAVRS